MKNFIKNWPVIGDLARRIYKYIPFRESAFKGSKNYWEKRYLAGGNSGNGSYNELAEFKADILNNFVSENNISSIIEFGCGDGNQLLLAKYPAYVGFDVSSEAIRICKDIFEGDATKSFKLLGDSNIEKGELTLSLDVIYHLIEDKVFDNYMATLFDSSNSYVIIYSSNSDGKLYETAPHVKHRNFTKWVESNRPVWKLVKHIPNKYPYIQNDNLNGSFADFYVYSITR